MFRETNSADLLLIWQANFRSKKYSTFFIDNSTSLSGSARIGQDLMSAESWASNFIRWPGIPTGLLLSGLGPDTFVINRANLWCPNMLKLYTFVQRYNFVDYLIRVLIIAITFYKKGDLAPQLFRLVGNENAPILVFALDNILDNEPMPT